MDFVQKPNFFLSALFTEILLENNVFYIKERKERFEVKKTVVKKRAKKWTFSKGVVSPWILSKNRIFLYGCFLQKLCQKKWFLIILDRKQTL